VAGGVDIVVVTHRHGDHLDETAVATLDPGIPVLCQPPDADFLAALGLQDLRPVEGAGTLQGLSIARTDGRHGTGELGDALGPVSGFVLGADGEPTLHVAGDTVWCEELSDALDEHRPDVVVVNAGGARFLEGDPITMTAEDVVAVAHHAPWATVVAVTPSKPSTIASRPARSCAPRWTPREWGSRVRIPADGEFVAPWTP
jgi:L-ascorbate metabolism protein UlaG (beta-lactamase superfamily)